MTSHPGAAPGTPARVIHHLEDVMGTKVIIDVYARPDHHLSGPASEEPSRQLAEGGHLASRR